MTMRTRSRRRKRKRGSAKPGEPSGRATKAAKEATKAATEATAASERATAAANVATQAAECAVQAARAVHKPPVESSSPSVSSKRQKPNALYVFAKALTPALQNPVECVVKALVSKLDAKVMLKSHQLLFYCAKLINERLVEEHMCAPYMCTQCGQGTEQEKPYLESCWCKWQRLCISCEQENKDNSDSEVQC